MEDRYLDKAFEKFKNELPVNYELKKELRKNFTGKRKSGVWKKLAAVAAAAAIIIGVTLLVPGNKSSDRVSAAELNIQNHISIVDIGNNEPLLVSEHNGKLYIPIFGEGVFVYDMQGLSEILDQDTSYVRVSPDGKQLAFSSGGSIKLYDLESKKIHELLKGDGTETFYEEPEWIDGNTILYTKKVIQFNDTHGFSVNESGIYSLDLKTMKSVKLTDGEHPSYVNGLNSIVFCRDESIFLLSLADKSEKTVDSGKYPSASPDGRYIAYVKTETTSKEVAENAWVEEAVNNIWISDTADLSIRKKLTENYPHYFINVDEWAESLEPSDIPQILQISGAYSYYEPAWSSNSQSIYAVKSYNGYEAGATGSRVMRIDLAPRVVSVDDTVRRFLQALVSRDDDYARSLMKEPPEVLTLSNPHPVGYRIIGSGEENGKNYIDAEVHWSYTANPYYQVVESRYYMISEGGRYIIDSIAEDSTIEVYEREGSVYLAQNGNAETVFGINDIPQDYLGSDNYRFSSLAYHPGSKKILFTLQPVDPGSGVPGIKVICYDLETGIFRLVDDMAPDKEINDMGAVSLTMDSGGSHVALDIFTVAGELYSNLVYVYDLETGQRQNPGAVFFDGGVQSVSTDFWDENRLVFSVNSDGQNAKYEYEPETGKTSSY